MTSSTQQDKPAVTVKVLADKLGTQPKDLRRFIRGMELGVGRGGRYGWASMSDPAVKRISSEWRKANGKEA